MATDQTAETAKAAPGGDTASVAKRIANAVTPEKPKKHVVIFIAMALIGTNLEIVSRAASNNLDKHPVGSDAISCWSLAGWSSLWMLPIYGFIGVTLGMANEKKEVPWLWSLVGRRRVIWQWILALIFILTIEYSAGWLLNLHCHLAIWSYLDSPGGDIDGQICTINAGLFFLLTPVAFYLDDAIRHLAYGEPHPDPFWSYFRFWSTYVERRERHRSDRTACAARSLALTETESPLAVPVPLPQR